MAHKTTQKSNASKKPETNKAAEVRTQPNRSCIKPTASAKKTVPKAVDDEGNALVHIRIGRLSPWDHKTSPATEVVLFAEFYPPTSSNVKAHPIWWRMMPTWCFNGLRYGYADTAEGMTWRQCVGLKRDPWLVERKAKTEAEVHAAVMSMVVPKKLSEATEDIFSPKEKRGSNGLSLPIEMPKKPVLRHGEAFPGRLRDFVPVRRHEADIAVVAVFVNDHPGMKMSEFSKVPLCADVDFAGDEDIDRAMIYFLKGSEDKKAFNGLTSYLKGTNWNIEIYIMPQQNYCQQMFNWDLCHRRVAFEFIDGDRGREDDLDPQGELFLEVHIVKGILPEIEGEPTAVDADSQVGDDQQSNSHSQQDDNDADDNQRVQRRSREISQSQQRRSAKSTSDSRHEQRKTKQTSKRKASAIEEDSDTAASKKQKSRKLHLKHANRA